MEEKYMKFCQSCMMPLIEGEESGTESDGSKSHKYCHYCYKDGEFTAPNATMEEMKNISDDALKEKGWVKPLRWLALMGFPKLERWKK
jgi:hypothetical protein